MSLLASTSLVVTLHLSTLTSFLHGTTMFEDIGDSFSQCVVEECNRARAKHAPMHSYHEGLAVLWEEFEELKQEVFKKNPDEDAMKEEVVQIAAMCRCFYNELLNRPPTAEEKFLFR